MHPRGNISGHGSLVAARFNAAAVFRFHEFQNKPFFWISFQPHRESSEWNRTSSSYCQWPCLLRPGQLSTGELSFSTRAFADTSRLPIAIAFCDRGSVANEQFAIDERKCLSKAGA